QEMQNPTRGRGPPLRKCRIPRAGEVHRSGNAESHALEGSTTREIQKPTCWSRPPLGKCRILRAGTVHRSRIAESHALEPSTAQKLQFFMRRMVPLYTNSD